MKQKKRVTMTVLLTAFIICFLILQNDQQVGNFSPHSTYLATNTSIHEQLCSDYSGDPSKDDVDQAHGVISYRQGKNQDLGIEYYIENGITNIPSEQMNKSLKALLMICIPWFVLIGASFILYFVTAYCFFDCCKCKGCLFNQLKDSNDMKYPYLASFIFNCAIFGISIYCVAVTMDQPYKNFRCLVSEVFTNASDGQYNNSNWQGMSLFVQDLAGIQSNLDAILDSTSQIANNISITNITNVYDELIKQNTILQNMQQQDSYYQKNSMLTYLANGTNINDTNLLNDLTKEQISPQSVLFQGFQKIITESLQNFQNKSQALADNWSTITSSLTAVQKNSATIQQGLQTTIQNYYTLTQDWDKRKDDLLLYYSIYFYVLLGLSAVILLVTYFIGRDQCIGLSKVSYAVAWVAYFILVIVAFAGCGLFETEIEILVEGYNHFKDISTNQTKLNSINQIIPDPQFKDFMSQCLYKDGNISQIFNLQSLNLISNLYAAVTQFKQDTTSIQSYQTKLNTSLQINSNYINSFSTFQRVDEKEPTDNNTNIKYLMRTAVKDCNNKQNSSVPDNMTYCDTNAYKYDPSVDSGKNVTPSTNQSVCFQSITFTTNRTLISQYIPNCDVITQIDSKCQSQVKLWQDAVKQENLILEEFKNLTSTINSTIVLIENYIGQYTQQFYILAENDKGLVPIVQSQNCSFFNSQIDRVYLGFYGLIQFFKIQWILNITIACLLFLSGIPMFRVLIDIYYLQNVPDNQSNQGYGVLPPKGSYIGKPDLTKV